MNIGILFALGALAGLGVAKLFMKKLTDEVESYTALVYFYFFSTITVVAFSLLTRQVVLPVASTWGLIIIAALIGAGAIYSLFRGLAVGQVSIVGPIAHTFVVLTVVLGLLVLNEHVTGLQVFGITIMILGVLAASFKWEQIRRAGRKEIVAGVPFALITAIGWGFYYFLLKIIVQRLNPISTTLFVEVAIALLVLLPLLHFGLKRISRKNLLHAVAGGTLTGLSALAFNTSISLVQVAIVAPIAAASPFLTVVLARIFLKEKLALNQLIAVVVVIAGVIILSM